MNPFAEPHAQTHISKLWITALKDYRYIATLFLGLSLGVLFFVYLPSFLLHNESIVGVALWDPITSTIAPINFNPYIFYITTAAIILGKITSIYNPRALVQMLLTLGIMNMLRILSLYLVNLEPPADIIMLFDPLLERTFYKDVVITKDLFFSGHTSNILVFGFLTQVRWLRKVFWIVGLSVGTMLVLQHVHYTIDVLVAPLVAYAVYRLVKYSLDTMAKSCP